MTREIDYRRAFEIACDLLNGDVLYGVDSDEIFKTMMDRDGVVTKDSYEKYILNHLQELDHGEYAIEVLEQEPTTKNDLGVDLISRADVLQILLDYDYASENALVLKDIKALPSVTPQESVLDKIRAEIERLQKMCNADDLNLMAQYSAFGMVLDILDKYKADRSEEDGNDD